jgi:hypothetical protein
MRNVPCLVGNTDDATCSITLAGAASCIPSLFLSVMLFPAFFLIRYRFTAYRSGHWQPDNALQPIGTGDAGSGPAIIAGCLSASTFAG